MDQMVEKLLEESEREKSRWWLMFVDTEKNTMLGAAIVEGHGSNTAVFNANKMGINPGGYPVGVTIPEFVKIDEKDMNRLLTGDEYKSLTAKVNDQLLGLGL